MPGGNRGWRRPGTEGCSRLPARGAGDPGHIAVAETGVRGSLRRVAALCPVAGEGTAPHILDWPSPPRGAVDECGRDQHHGAEHRLCRRFGQCADQPLQPSLEDPAAAHRTHIPGERRTAQGALRPHRSGYVLSPVFPGRLRHQAAVHGPGAEADQPCLRRAADAGVAPRQDRGLSVHRSAGRPRGQGRGTQLERIGRARWRTADADRSHHGAAAGGPAPGANACGCESAAMRQGDAHHRLRPLDPGPARASARQTRGGGSETPRARGQEVGFPRLRESLERVGDRATRHDEERLPPHAGEEFSFSLPGGRVEGGAPPTAARGETTGNAPQRSRRGLRQRASRVTGRVAELHRHARCRGGNVPGREESQVPHLPRVGVGARSSAMDSRLGDRRDTTNVCPLCRGRGAGVD